VFKNNLDIHFKEGIYELNIKNSVAASDAFFPFSDGVEELIKKGVKAIIQPGGSINDKDVIKAADNADIIMALTGIRHFKH
jgi:phosphoribosylaminoimidazolecarboxamide formyltransferase/IMP cyclohydrolase